VRAEGRWRGGIVGANDLLSKYTRNRIKPLEEGSRGEWGARGGKSKMEGEWSKERISQQTSDSEAYKKKKAVPTQKSLDKRNAQSLKKAPSKIRAERV